VFSIRKKMRLLFQFAGRLNVLRYEPVGLYSRGTKGGLDSNGCATFRKKGSPKPCISQLDGTVMSDHFWSLKFDLKKSLGVPSGVLAKWNFHLPFKESTFSDFDFGRFNASSTDLKGIETV